MTRRKRLLAPVLVFLAVLLLITAGWLGWRSRREQSSLPGEPFAVLVDQFDREVIIPVEPRRIVSTAPSNTEILFALGLGEKVVAVSDWCVYPPEVRELEKIGDIFPINVERVLSFAPDLVLAHEFSGKESVLKLEELGVPVLAFRPHSFADILDSIIIIGRATGQTARAEELVADLQAILDRVAAEGEKIGQRGLKVYAGEIGGEMLWTAGPGSFMDQAITLAGGVNIGGDLAKSYAQMSMETILQKNPDLILLTTPGDDPEKVYKDSLWQETAAVKNRRVFPLDDVFSIPGPRMIEALEDLLAIFAACE